MSCYRKSIGAELCVHPDFIAGTAGRTHGSPTKKQGFVLWIVLLLMQILALLNWHALENLLLLTRFQKNLSMHEVLHQQGIVILDRIEQSILNTLPDCIISITEPQQLAIKSPNEWSPGAICTGNFQEVKYYYVVEFLTADPCTLIVHIQAIAGYFRVTLFLQRNNQHLLLQSTLIRPVVESRQKCEGLSRIVGVGRQSWYELPTLVRHPALEAARDD